MLLVKTRLAPSPIAGIGLFADEDIKKGTVTWRFMAAWQGLAQFAQALSRAFAHAPAELK